jgi:hypothetical protein
MAAYETGRFADVPPEQVTGVRSLADLAGVVVAMREDLLHTGREQWGNTTLEAFLEALAAVAEDRGFQGTPTWADVADLLVTATGYE